MENANKYTAEKWKQLTAFSKKEELKNKMWNSVVDHYNEPYRFYHTLNHVASLFEKSEHYMAQIESPATVGFAILYHDVVYDTFKDNNAEESALFARQQLSALNIKEAIIKDVETFILATKTHTLPEGYHLNNDLSLFLDLDLTILATSWDEYELYSEQIRKEYRQYPDVVYNPGRKHALEKLSKKEFVYFTPPIKEVLEPIARQNIFREIQLLS
ncbi:MAG: hypothetical protein LH478_10590 [Chitinophagaceae bacterium]|nr:hypothetical protein [Chitinophagaceae bacterium]